MLQDIYRIMLDSKRAELNDIDQFLNLGRTTSNVITVFLFLCLFLDFIKYLELFLDLFKKE